MNHDVAAGERARRRGEIEDVALDERDASCSTWRTAARSDEGS
jgi:hypothetical protein